MISIRNLLICLAYGMLSTCQTLNSRYLFRSIGFDYYSFSFFIQRIVNIIFFLLIFKTHIRKSMIYTIIPYSLFMCTTNILSSYCVTVLPLAAFMAFKKIIVFFILVIAFIFGLEKGFSKFQYSCIFFIVLGGLLVGERDILKGEFIGYVAAICYNVCEAGTLEYQAYMKRVKKYEPQEVLVMNSILSLPYYLVLMTYQNQFVDIYNYFTNSHLSIQFILSFCLLLILACLSQFTASYIAMNISPFQKATVSNIKDILLTFISVYYFKDFILGLVSEIGIVFCLTASLIFSYTLLTKGQNNGNQIVMEIQQLEEEEGLTLEDRIQRELAKG